MLFMFLLLLTTSLFAEIPTPPPQPRVAWSDGKIVFLDGYVPTQYELLIATSGIKFDNYTDYTNCVNSTSAVIYKINGVQPQVQAVKDAITVINAAAK